MSFTATPSRPPWEDSGLMAANRYVYDFDEPSDGGGSCWAARASGSPR